LINCLYCILSDIAEAMFDIDNLEQFVTPLNTTTSFEFVFWVSRSLKVSR